MFKSDFLIRLFSLIAMWLPTFGYGDATFGAKDEQVGQSRWSLGLMATYINSESTRLNAIEDTITIGGRNILIPVNGDGYSNVDLFVFRPVLTYGLDEKTSLEGSFSYVTGKIRGIGSREEGLVIRERGFNYFSDISLGISRRIFTSNTKETVVNLRGELGVAQSDETTGGELGFTLGKDYTIGLRAQTAINPIILTGELSYDIRVERTIDSAKYNPPDQLTINSGVVFAVNDTVSLAMGVVWSRKSESTVEDIKTSISRTNTRTDFGINYNISANISLFSKVQADISGESGARINMGIEWRP